MGKVIIEGMKTPDFEDEFKIPDEISKLSNFMLEHIYIRTNMPWLLAKVALAGHRDKALDALVAWGTGKSPIIQLWKEMSPLINNLNEQESK